MIVRSALACLVLFAAIVLTAGHSTAHAQGADTELADAVFDRLLAKYNTIDALRAEFTQTMSSSYMDQDESFTGLLILQGEKFRIETGTEVLVVNGQETYIYRPSEQQVLINNVVEDEASFLPNEFLLNHDERFDVLDVDKVTYDGEQHYRLNLKPKDADSFFREATLWMRDRDDVITKLTVLDVNETRMVFILDNIELNPSLDADTFSFIPPDGVEIIDLRS